MIPSRIFEGDPVEYGPWMSYYESVVAGCEMTEAQKFELVKKCMRGKAAESIAHLRTEDESLGKALDIL